MLTPITVTQGSHTPFVKFLNKFFFCAYQLACRVLTLASCVSLYIVLPRHADMPKN